MDEENTDALEGETPPAHEDAPIFADELSDEDETEGDPLAGQPAPDWVREQRRENRELKRKLKELESQRGGETPPDATDPGDEPTLEDCDYDGVEYARRLREYDARKAEHDARTAAQRAEAEAQEAEWAERVETYEQNKARYAPDVIEDAEATVEAVLDKVQIGVILNAADNAPGLFVALSKSPKLKELAAIKNPHALAARVGALEANLGKKTRRAAPTPNDAPTVPGRAPGTAAKPSGNDRTESIRAQLAARRAR